MEGYGSLPGSLQTPHDAVFMTHGWTTGRSREGPAWTEALSGLDPASSKESNKKSAPAVTRLRGLAVRRVGPNSRREGVVRQR